MMTWGPCFMYYYCPECGTKFKYAIDMISVLGQEFGYCPNCSAQGILLQEGARITEDNQYIEVE